MSRALRERWLSLERSLRSHQRVLVAFSGGCDSTFLMAAARRTLGRENVLAVTAVSASLPSRDKNSAARLAARLDIPYLFVATGEMANPSYVSNPVNRCFFCKDELFGKLAPLAESRRMVLADGFNLSDRADYRPGFQAAQKWNVAHPLEEAGLEKRDIRVLSRWMGLPTWNKPAGPCLSSRIPYGTPVSEEILRRVEAAESALQEEGFPVVRVRHYGDEARVEVPLRDLDRLREVLGEGRVASRLNALGYRTLLADPRGFKSGRLNESILPDAHAYEKNLFSERDFLDSAPQKSIICLTNFHEHNDRRPIQVKR